MNGRHKHCAMATLLCVVFTAEAQAALPNAWQITDNSTASGSGLGYTNQLSASDRFAATNGGFRFAVHARLVTNYAGAKTMTMHYGLGNRRFLIWWNLDTNGNLTAELEGSSTFTLTSFGNGSLDYHTHEIIYNPATGSALYRFDGEEKAIWSPSAIPYPAGKIAWGAGSSPGKGQMNFNRVIFEVTNTVVASYDAGTNETTAMAPNPTTQGWTLDPPTPLAGTGVAAVSPDADVLQVAVTLPADQITDTSARLNGQIHFGGKSTVLAYFAWGTSTNYGNITQVQSVNVWDDPSPSIQAVLGGLVSGREYHYRLMSASSIYGTAEGVNQSFHAAAFSPQDIPGLPGVQRSSVAWGDYDNDGRLDFLMTGGTASADNVSQLWRNTSNGFTNAPIHGLPGVLWGSVAWGDYDNDGRLDIVLTGDSTTGQVSQLWRNMGSSFTNVAIPDLPGIERSSAAWGDYDNDGRLDFLLMGTTNGSVSGMISQLWRNKGSGFTNVPVPGLPGVYFGSVAWGDYDNDGQLDFLITGTTNGSGSGVISRFWRNTGSGFTNVPVPGLPGVYFSSVAWGDYDNDGRLDFLLTGFSETGRVSQLWRNMGSGFTNVPIPGLPGVYLSSVAWGDYDNDGQLDFLLTGDTGSGRIAQVWRNTGSGFSQAPIALPAVYFGSVAWGDYDNDGRLDFLLTGTTNGLSSGAISQLWRNRLPLSNDPPAAPAALAATASGDALILHWNPPVDDHTPSAGLNYNVRIGSAPGAADVLSPMALANGLRLVPALGNAQTRTNAHYQLPPGQTYYWSVQSVDNAFAGGPFAIEASFVVAPPALSILSTGTNAIISWQPSYPGWILQESLSLAPVAWSNSPTGAANPVSVPATNETMFYRLIKP